MERALYITNYRNIGFGKSERIVLNHSLEKGKMGDLVVIIGANNSGKSNVLDAICSFGTAEFSKRDVTTLSYESNYSKPQIGLTCKNSADEYTYRLTFGQTKTPYLHFPQAPKPITIQNRSELSSIIAYIRQRFDSYSFTVAGKRSSELSILCDKLLQIIEKISLDELQSEVNTIVNLLRHFQPHSTGSETLQYIRSNFGNSEFIQLYEPSSLSLLETQYQELYGMKFVPKIVRYQDNPISNVQLWCPRTELSQNSFLLTVFDKIKITKELIDNTYAAFQKQDNNKGVLDNLESRANQGLSKLAEDFNKLYFAKNEKYSFKIGFESEKIFFYIQRGGLSIALDHQSTGFRWFFNMYFNLLCKNNLQPGDIIVMDQPGMDLHIKGREELRKFLKEFSIRNDLTIVIATHEPSMIDLDCLDEIRVISMKDNQSTICNDFAAIDPDDPDCLKPIKEALTVDNRILFDPDMNLVFVEGITDYNYLLAFKKLLGFKNMSFLPIKGVGNMKDPDIEQKQKNLSQELMRMKKHNPILLVDSDVAGLSMKELNDPKESGLRVCSLDEIDSKFKTIESLFDPEDRKNLGLVDETGKYVKHASNSSIIKNHIESYEFSEVTKENFRKLLTHLDD